EKTAFLCYIRFILNFLEEIGMIGKVRLRTFEKEDIDFIHRLTNNPDVMSYWFEEAYNSKAKLEEVYMKNKDSSRERLFILDKDDEQLGFLALYSIDS